jgi:hypothetical protein
MLCHFVLLVVVTPCSGALFGILSHTFVLQRYCPLGNATKAGVLRWRSTPVNKQTVLAKPFRFPSGDQSALASRQLKAHHCVIFFVSFNTLFTTNTTLALTRRAPYMVCTERISEEREREIENQQVSFRVNFIRVRTRTTQCLFTHHHHHHH